MSGIVGIINLDGAPIDRDLLSSMTDYMAFRGPVQQPLTLDAKFWLTADARIDAREELIAKAQRQTHCETKPKRRRVDPSRYETWGEDCLNHLLGDFAFAIWDSRTRRLFCARDHFGVKPFFFARNLQQLIFSNTLNALRLDAGVSDELNEIAIGDYLLFGVEPGSLNHNVSRHSTIARRPQSHVSDGSITTRRYWTPSIIQRDTFSRSLNRMSSVFQNF